MKKTLPLLLICFSCYFIASSQIGGKNAYEFINLPSSARITALGGHLPSVIDEDLTVAISNPASLNEKMHNRISFSHNFHFADIQNGYVAFGRIFKKWDVNTHLGVQYINYGDFKFTDILGNQDGTFGAKEAALIMGVSKKIADRITIGTNIKGVFSNLETYSSTGLLFDIGLNYVKDSSNTILSFIVKNLGTELTTYAGERFGTPLDIQIGLSKRLKYLPFRLSVIAHQLHRVNIRYDDPNRKIDTDIFGNLVEEKKFKNTIDNIFRHLVFSGEFLLGKNENLRLRAGYSHLRRKELSLSTFKSLAGFSLGFGIKINVFKIDYGLGYHHTVGATNHISFSTDLGKFFKKI